MLNKHVKREYMEITKYLPILQKIPNYKNYFIIEGANQPITAIADKELRAQGVLIVPDILANSGGVMGSYFEWTQNIQEFSWPIEKFRRELDARMEKAFINVDEVAKKYSVDLRTAAFVVSVGRVAEAFEMRGSLV
jgi:glutamate dehydrogenase (NAD(P)+)